MDVLQLEKERQKQYYFRPEEEVKIHGEFTEQ